MKLNIPRVFYVNQKVPKQEEGATYKKASEKKTARVISDILPNVFLGLTSGKPHAPSLQHGVLPL